MKTMKRLSTILAVLILLVLTIAVSVSADSYPESNHDYANSMDYTWYYYHPDPSVESLKITFSSSTKVERNYDYIYIYTDSGTQIGKYTDTELAGVTVEVPGSSFRIRLTSDYSGTFYGFAITDIEGVGGAVSQSTAPESSHPYTDYSNQIWVYEHPDQSAEYLNITFNSQTYTEPGYDYIYIYDLEGTQIGRYSGSTLAGQTISVTGTGFKIKLTSDSGVNYYGFKIDNITGGVRTSMSKCTISLGASSVYYDGYEKTPSVTVKHGNTTLVEGEDYTVSYQNNVEIGTGKVTVTGMGRYKGSVNKTFKILAPLPESNHNYGSYTDYTWTYAYSNSSAQYLKVKFSSDTYVEKNYDYIYVYAADGTEVGKYTGSELAGKTIRVKGNSFSVRLTSDWSGSYYGFKVESVSGHMYTSISKCSITLSKTSVTYNGQLQKPSVTVKYGSKTLKKGTDYKVTYSNHRNAGTAKVKITGLGAYNGSVTKTFTIKKLSLANVSVSKISNQKYTGEAIKPKITVKSGSNAITTSNYTVKYSSNTKVGTATITITAKGSNTTGSKKVTFKIIPKLATTKKNMYKGKSFTLKLNGVSVSKVKFSSSKTSVCTVTSKGVVKAKKAGTAKIYAKYNGLTYTCTVTVLNTASSSSSTAYYKNHDDVPDFGALVKIEPTSSTTSSSSGDTFLYSLSDLQKVDPDQEAGDKYCKLLTKSGFTKKSGTFKIDGKSYYKYVSEKKIVYFGIASKNGEVKVIIKKN